MKSLEGCYHTFRANFSVRSFSHFNVRASHFLRVVWHRANSLSLSRLNSESRASNMGTLHTLEMKSLFRTIGISSFNIRASVESLSRSVEGTITIFRGS